MDLFIRWRFQILCIAILCIGISLQEDCGSEHLYRCPTPANATCACKNINTLCDGFEDCPNGEDENSTFCVQQCSANYGSWCPSSRYSRGCVLRTEMCDGTNKCGRRFERARHCRRVGCPVSIAGTDRGYTLCGSSLQCVLNEDICTAARDGTASPCVNGWLPNSISDLCGEIATTEEPLLETTEEPLLETTAGSVGYTINGVYADCTGSTPLTAMYSGVAIPYREVGNITNGASVCEGALYAHNKVRQNHENTPPLVYSDVLAAQAEAWAVELANTESAAFLTSPSPPATNNGAGENMAVLFRSGQQLQPSMADAMSKWYNPHILSGYDFTSGTGSGDISQFTQVLWADTREVGCGIALDPTNDAHYAVCHYSPAGNVAGQNVQKVKPLLAGATTPTAQELESMNNGCILQFPTCYLGICPYSPFDKYCALMCDPACAGGSGSTV